MDRLNPHFEMPTDVWKQVLGYLSHGDLLTTRWVCRYLRAASLAYAPSFEAISGEWHLLNGRAVIQIRAASSSVLGLFEGEFTDGGKHFRFVTDGGNQITAVDEKDTRSVYYKHDQTILNGCAMMLQGKPAGFFCDSDGKVFRIDHERKVQQLFDGCLRGFDVDYTTGTVRFLFARQNQHHRWIAIYDPALDSLTHTTIDVGDLSWGRWGLWLDATGLCVSHFATSQDACRLNIWKMNGEKLWDNFLLSEHEWGQPRPILVNGNGRPMVVTASKGEIRIASVQGETTHLKGHEQTFQLMSNPTPHTAIHFLSAGRDCICLWNAVLSQCLRTVDVSGGGWYANLCSGGRVPVLWTKYERITFLLDSPIKACPDKPISRGWNTEVWREYHPWLEHVRGPLAGHKLLQFVLNGKTQEIRIEGNWLHHYHLISGKKIQSLPIPQAETITSASPLPLLDKSFIVFGCRSGNLLFLHLESGTYRQAVQAHEGPIKGLVTLSDDNNLLIVSGGEDGKLKWWSNRGKLLGEWDFGEPITTLDRPQETVPIVIIGGSQGRVASYDLLTKQTTWTRTYQAAITATAETHFEGGTSIAVALANGTIDWDGCLYQAPAESIRLSQASNEPLLIAESTSGIQIFLQGQPHPIQTLPAGRLTEASGTTYVETPAGLEELRLRAPLSKPIGALSLAIAGLLMHHYLTKKYFVPVMRKLIATPLPINLLKEAFKGVAAALCLEGTAVSAILLYVHAFECGDRVWKAHHRIVQV